MISDRLGNVVLEAPDSIYREYKSELDHSDYLKEQEKGWSTVSISSLEGKDILSGEDAIADHTQNVETEAVQLLLLEKLRVAIKSVSDRSLISEVEDPGSEAKKLGTMRNCPTTFAFRETASSYQVSIRH